MLKTNGAIGFFVAALALGSLPALAADTMTGHQPAVQAQEVRLESAYRTLASNESTKKLGTTQQAEVMRQRIAIKDMIRKLEAGDPVAPSEVDRVLHAR